MCLLLSENIDFVQFDKLLFTVILALLGNHFSRAYHLCEVLADHWLFCGGGEGGSFRVEHGVLGQQLKGLGGRDFEAVNALRGTRATLVQCHCFALHFDF